MRRLNSRGDTIIEVILAMALLALVLFSSWSITNRASQISLAARQRTVMINQLKEQAELLKALHQASPEKIYALKNLGPTGVALSTNPCQDVDTTKPDNQQPGSKLTNAFIMRLSGTNELEMSAGSKLVEGEQSQRVWLQRELLNTNQGFIDFYVRGCWQTTGGTQKFDNSQFIVRINVPKETP